MVLKEDEDVSTSSLVSLSLFLTTRQATNLCCEACASNQTTSFIEQR
jgi:hypothetical protein